MRYLRICIAVICQINLQQKVFGLDPQYYSCKEFHVSAFVFRLLSIGNANSSLICSSANSIR